MNRDQAYALVRQTFTRAFDRPRYANFARNLLNHLDDSKAGSWTSVKGAFKSHVERYERVGTYTSPDDSRLDVLIVHLTKESKLERARTAVRNFVADHLKSRDERDAALVAFVSPTENQWRFSYVKMEYASTVESVSGRVGVETRLTPARRFSYIVGEGESCHTAQTRFLQLLQNTGTNPTLADIESAFSVEVVTKEFFARYADLFAAINTALEDLAAKDKTLRNHFRAKAVSTVDFAKKLMGQVVFLYFLQKKGWLGVPKGKDWGAGPRDFLRRLANGQYAKYANFFNDVLEPLFYDTLATDRGHLAWCTQFQSRIPFLNGGLFEPLSEYDWKKTDVLIPNRLFTNNDPVDEGITGSGILDVFDRYNFTVNEAEPLEKEVAIDPEMLGKVFENLIESNRRRGLGAYYTPREIVHYMCQESLINYLDTAVNTRETPLTKVKATQSRLFGASVPVQTALKAEEYHEVIPRSDIETFVHLGEQISHYEAVETTYAIRMPKSIEQHARLLDERLGSIAVCDPAVGSGAFPVGMMTEIARARSALTPYFNATQERTPYHFKRHAIQNCLYGVDIDSGAVEIAKLRLWLSLVVDEEETKQIKPLPNLDFKIIAGDSLQSFPFRSQRLDAIEKLKARFFEETDHDRKAELKREIDRELSECFASSKKSLGYEVNFDFRIYFSEVFQARGGFDVVIANPPYVSVEKFARTALQGAWKRRFKTYASRCDIYCFFYEQGLALLRDGGVLTFISSNKFQRAGYGKGLRDLLGSQQIRTLIDFCELPVFAAATDPMIVIVAKTPAAASKEFPVLVVKDEDEFGSLPQSLEAHASRYKPEQLRVEGWSLQGGQGLDLVSKLRAKGTELGEYVDRKLYRGIITGLNEAFVIDRETRDRLIREDRRSAELIRPWIRGRDIKRWSHEFHDLYVIVVRYGFHTGLKKYPAILRHLSQFEDRLKARGQCRTSRSGVSKGQHHWLELDNNPLSEYLGYFETPSVVYADIGRHLKAFLSKDGVYFGNTAYFIPDAQPFLLAILLSRALDYVYRHSMQPLGDPWTNGRMRFFSRTMIAVPIPPASAAQKARLSELAERAAKLAAKADFKGVEVTERQIDEIVYRLFGLTPAEIAQIEDSLVRTRRVNRDEESEEEEELELA